MGFLKFLKRDKGKEPDLGMEDLDVPPLPPGMEEKELSEGEKELPELPELPEMPELEEQPEIKEKPIPELDIPPKPAPELGFPSLKPKEGLEPGPSPKPLPSMPELPKLEEGIEEPESTQPRRPLFGMRRPVPIPGMPELQEQKPKVEAPKITPYERFERAAVREQRGVLKHKEAEGPIYVRIERFRDILTGTRTIKNNLKTAGQSIVKLNEIDADRDKVLERWHNSMMDLQKKLIFIDKTLFKR